MNISMPQYVQEVLLVLKKAGFEAFVVGGSVRDLYLGKQPKDYDMTTNATPKQIQEVFEDTLYNNNFGTVGVRIVDAVGKRQELEITPYRAEAEYSDGRHPDKIKFGVSLEEDLKRRDFTVNAMAYDGEKLIDLFGGKKDCDAGIIQTVGNPEERFGEDALRILRAARFAAQLDFSIAKKTEVAMKKLAPTIQRISWERIRDELMKTVAADNSFRGLYIMHTVNILQEILPELEEGVGVTQNKHHIYTVFMHNMQAMQYAPTEDTFVRFAALLHDIGKPRVKEGEGINSTFHNHEHIGADMVKEIMQRLKFSKKDTDRVEHLVRQHMFYYSQGEITDAGIRRLVKRMGKEHFDDLMAIRIGDRMGSGCQKEKPYKLVEFENRVREVEKDPMDTRMLNIDGHEVMKITGMKPGRTVGKIMNALLEDVLEDPSLNNIEYLSKRAQDIYTKIAKEDE